MDFGLFNTWNALYEGDMVPWHPDYQGGKLLEEDAYIKNYEEIDAVEEMGWDYIWLGGGHFSKAGQHGPPGADAGRRHRRAHRTHQDWLLHPPARLCGRRVKPCRRRPCPTSATASTTC